MRECELNIHLRLTVKAKRVEEPHNDAEILKVAQEQLKKALPEATVMDVRVVRVLKDGK